MRPEFREEASIPEVISAMTPEEKAALISLSGEPGGTCAIEDMEVPGLSMCDGATGVNSTNRMMDFIVKTQRESQKAETESVLGPWNELAGLLTKTPEEAKEQAKGSEYQSKFMEYLKEVLNPDGQSVSFPSGNLIGAGFDEDTAYRIGEAVGMEMRASHVDICFGPNVDIIRDPLGGRNYEMYGEDPVLVGRTAAAFIRGMQSTGTAACAKHFIANNQETRRQTKDTHVSKRTLRELYAIGFEKAVKDAGVKTVMSAYNAVNGEFSSYNKELLTDWLKDEWGFDGVVISDSGAVTGRYEEAVEAGLDLILHGPTSPDGKQAILEAMKDGRLPLNRVNDAIERLLKLVLWQRKAREQRPYTYSQKELLERAYDTCVEGMVLLKNENALPLSAKERIGLFGKRARQLLECGGGSTFVTTPLHGNLQKELKKCGAQAVLDDADTGDGKAYETVLYVAGAEGGENADRPDMRLDREDAEQIAAVLKKAKEQGKKTVVLLNIAGPVEMEEWIDQADAVLVNFIPGCMGAKAAADVLLGSRTPGGKLPMTFPVKLADSPSSPYPTGEQDDVYYSEGVFVGYRWYDYKQIPVQYPFGYGLSYTTFKVSVVDVPDSWDLKKDEKLLVTVQVENTGKRFGSEVVQLYMGQKDPRIPMPQKELKAYVKVRLKPGEKTEAVLAVKKEDLKIYDPQRGLLTPIGAYELQIGTDSREMFYRKTLRIRGKNPYLIDEHSTLAEVLANEKAVEVLDRFLPGMSANIRKMSPALLGFMKGERIGPLLSRQLIHTISDANELKAMLDRLFEALAKIEE